MKGFRLFNNIAVLLPPEWINTIRTFSLVSRQRIVLSGGALRDLYLGKPPKDLDLFLPYSEEAEANIHTQAQSLGYTRFQQVDNEYVQNLSDVEYVAGYRHPLNIELNFVFLNSDKPFDAFSVAFRNDFGICQIATRLSPAGFAETIVTNAFDEDVRDKTFTITHDHDPARSKRRWERLREKFPEYRLVEAPFVPIPLEA